MQDVLHLLNRIGFGPRPGDVDRVQALGVRDYIDQQLHPERINDEAVEARLTSLPSIRMSTPQIIENYQQPRERLRMLIEELVAHKIVRATHSSRQLQEVMTDFWFNHFNVFWGKNAVRFLTTAYEMNAIRPHALGKFKDLLMATAKSPAMLFYLDNHVSSPLGGINENYARELMELHTLGVDGGYTQKDIQEVARALTGWSIDGPRLRGEFMFRPRRHDTGTKIVLGNKIDRGGIRDGEEVIEILAGHPSTANFLSSKLVRKFVSDEPPSSLVRRVTDVYTRTGGDIRDMMREIVTPKEFDSSQARGSKMKTPFEYAVSAIRSLNGTSAGSRQLAQFIGRMGQPLYQYQAPTGFPDRRDYWTGNSATLERLNFALALAANRIPGTTVEFSEPVKSVVRRLGSPDFQMR